MRGDARAWCVSRCQTSESVPVEEGTTHVGVGTTLAERHLAWQVFQECDLWDGASESSMRQMFDSSAVQRFAKGDTVLGPETVGLFAVVASGQLRSLRIDSRGRQLSYERAQAGEAVAAISAVHDEPLSIAFVATESTVVVIVGSAALRVFLLEEPTAAYRLMMDFSKRFLQLQDAYTLQSAEVHCRLAAFILRHMRLTSHDGQSGARVSLGMTRRDLAAALGTVPETLSRAFTKLRADGLVESDGGPMVTVLNVQGLEELVP